MALAEQKKKKDFCLQQKLLFAKDFLFAAQTTFLQLRNCHGMLMFSFLRH